MAINPMGTLPPELYEQQQQLNRQQRMAQALIQQGQQQPQGQMVSGRFVPTSFFQNIAPLVQTYLGTRMAEKGDKQALDLAKQLRQLYGDELQQFRKTMQGQEAVPEQVTEMAGPYGQGVGDGGMNVPMPTATIEGRAAVAPNPQAAYDFASRAYNPALQQLGLKKLTEGPMKVGAEETLIDPITMKPVFTGAGKFRAPLQIDTGTAIELRDPTDPSKVLSRIPKTQMPTAGQVYESSEGPLLINTRAGTATPLMGLDGKPLSPKLSSEQQKDITAINQQKATIDSALELVKATPSAFSFARGAAVALPFGESLAGRAEKPEETQARAAVFNIVSKVINERAGAAQSAQEIKRLNAFLPSEFDNATQIQNKLKGFNTFLSEQEKGTRVPASRITPPSTASTPNVFASETDVQRAITSGSLKKGDKVTVNGVTGTIQ
jgi:hypothetical protein